MTIKMAILNPQNGEYNYIDTMEELVDALAKQAVEFYLIHTHGSPFSTIEVLEDGSEMWRNSSGNEILSPAQMKEAAKHKIKDLVNYKGKIPVTNLS